MNIYDPRIQPYNSTGRAWSTLQVPAVEDAIIDDSNDLLEDQAGAFAVTRPGKCKSKTLIKLVNKFGQEGGFQRILERIQDQQNRPEIDIVCQYIEYIGNLYAVLHRSFVVEYIPKLKDVIFNYLLYSPETMLRNFTKEKIDLILKHTDNLLKRIITIQEKNEILNKFVLELALVCFNSPFLGLRIQGLKQILEQVKAVRFNQSKNIGSQYLNQWLQNHKIIQAVYSLQGHIQLITRTADLIRYLSFQKILTSEDIDMIWSATQRENEEQSMSIYKLLNDVAMNLQPEYLDVFLQKIIQISPKDLLTQELELAYELTRFEKTGIYCAKAKNFFYQIINSSLYSKQIQDLAMVKFCDIMKNDNLKNERMDICIQSVQNLQQQNSINILQKILTQYPTSQTQNEQYTRTEAIELLVNQHNLLQIFFEFFKGSQMNTLEIEQGLQFLNFIYQNSTFQISGQTLDFLWDNLYISQPMILLKWLKEAADSQSQGKSVFVQEDCINFFSQRMGNADNDFSNLTLEGLKCFKSYFNMVNELQSKMRRKENQNSQQQAYIYYCYYYYYPSQEAKKEENEFCQVILTQPDNLTGINALWKIAMVVQENTVYESTLSFLIDIYTYLEESVNLQECRQEYINRCFQLIKQENASENQIKRVIGMIKKLMEESEKSGLAGLKSHDALLKGELLTLTIINNSQSAQKDESPKRFDVKVYQNCTFWELKGIIGKNLKVTRDQIKLIRNLLTKEVKDTDNGKTLFDLRIRNKEIFNITKNMQSNIPRVDLILRNGELNPKAKAIFEQWFDENADIEGKMSPIGCANFINSCTGDNCKPNDKRVTETFMAYDSDGDKLLTKEDFVRFYTQATREKESIVWSNFIAHDYRNDLKKFSDISEEDADVDQTQLPRYLLSNNKEFFKILFSLLYNKAIANDVWQLIIKLPTNTEIYQQLLEINQPWENLIEYKSSHKSLYSLQIIQHLMQETDSKEELIITWLSRFIKSGGFQYVYQYVGQEGITDIFTKSILSFKFQMLRIFILAAQKATKSKAYEIIELARKKSKTDEEVKETPVKKEEDKEQPKERVPLTNQEQDQPPQAQEPKKEEEEREKDEEKEKQEELTFNFIVNCLIKDQLQQDILNSVEFQKLLNQLLLIMNIVLHFEEMEFEDRTIVENALSLQFACLAYQPQILVHFYEFKDQYGDCNQFIINGLNKPKSDIIRKSVQQALYQMAKNIEAEGCISPKIYLIKLLLSKCWSPSNDCAQMFNLLISLIEDDLPQNSAQVDYASLFKELIEAIKKKEITESRIQTEQDKILIGLFQLLAKLSEKIPELRETVDIEDLINYIFTECLFSEQQLESLAQPKAKHRFTRQAAYNLIQILVKDKPDILQNIFNRCIIKLSENIPKINGWNYSPSNDNRSLLGHIGIRNLGCICYMNAMLQQFYMIPQFRYSILSVDDKKEPTNLAFLRGDPGVDRNQKGVEIDDNMLHQLQYLFGYLEFSERHFYNPANFCFSFKDFSGNPTNVFQQQDAQEFLNMMFDRVENMLKTSPQKYMLYDVFGGKQCQLIKCTKCNRTSEREDVFFNLSLQIKHKKNIYESLETFVESDVISGYGCEGCNSKVEARKRVCLSELPNICIIHLQRIVFNLDTLLNEKINSRLEFPELLDLTKYTKWGLEDQQAPEGQEAQYKLIGVVIQVGTAESGHYFSYIRSNQSNFSALNSLYKDQTQRKEKWLEFNDTNVKFYNFNNIEIDAFGGEIQGQQNDA